jgi:hypothetical protein
LFVKEELKKVGKVVQYTLQKFVPGSEKRAEIFLQNFSNGSFLKPFYISALSVIHQVLRQRLLKPCPSANEND